ncbi:MAG: hypothetical protein M3440_08475 [Chloroflexota bacterium]|nr:hypothetical protein [Chloroflexota bacterium]
MPLTMTNTNTASNELYRKDAGGGTSLVRVDRETYVVPKPGPYTLELTGLSEPFELADTFNDGAMKMMVRVEVAIRDHAKANRNGQRFSVLMKLSLNERASLGKVVAAINGRALKPNEEVELTDFLGGRFSASVGNNLEGTRANIASDSILPIEADDDEGDNPFADDDEA